MRKNILFTTLVAAVLGVGSPALATVEAVWGLGDTFRDYEILALDPTVTRADLADGSFSLTLFGERYDLDVSTAPFFQGPVTIGRLHADGTVTSEPATFESVVMTGAGVNRPGVTALVVVQEPGVGGQLSSEHGAFAFQPLSLLRPGAPAGLTVAYRIADVVKQDIPHEHETLTAPPGMQPPPIDPAPEGWSGPDRRITLWADSQMSAQAGFATTISNAFYTMANQYATELGWTYSIVNNAIYTCYDAACDSTWGMSSSNSGTLLPTWGAQVPNNTLVGTGFDNAVLSSGKDFEGSVIGRGYQPGRYNVNQLPGLASWTQALLLGHETGHNYNGDHGNRGIPSPGRATSSNHVHSSNHCHIGPVLGVCLQNHVHNDNYTHYTLMWPTLYGNSGTNEQFFDAGPNNEPWMQNCNNLSFSSGSYTPGNAGFGFYCLN